MAIKLNGQKPASQDSGKKLNLNQTVHEKAENKRLSQIRDLNEYDAARERLMDDFIQDMNDSSIAIEVSDEQMKQQEKRYKSLRARKFGTYIVFCLFFITVTVCGVYNTFFKHEYTGEEIAYLANKFNNQTNFPKDGVQGYLDYNLSQLMGERLQIDSGIENVSVSNPKVTRINAKSNNLSNVYFYFDINSNNGTQTVDAILPLSWDSEKMKYLPNGEIMITPNTSTNNKTDKTEENSLLSFDDIAKESNENISSSQTFVDNFFTMLYSGQSIDPYYAGTVEMDSGDMEYKGITKYVLYKGTNANGYNAECDITLKMKNGISYTTQKYISIVKDGKSWIINGVL